MTIYATLVVQWTNPELPNWVCGSYYYAVARVCGLLTVSLHALTN